MEFDIDSLKPTYKFLLEIPGQSNALEISKRLGLPQNIVDNAANMATDESQELNDMIADLVERRNAVLDQQVQLSNQILENRKVKNEYDPKVREVR